MKANTNSKLISDRKLIRLTLKILLLTLTTLPAVGCFSIRYRDPGTCSYEKFTDTTDTLSISGDFCKTSDRELGGYQYAQSGEDSSRQESTDNAPLPRFLPAPTQPVFNTRAEYDPPQAMLKQIPVNLSQESMLSEFGFKDKEPKLQQIQESDVYINPIKDQPRRIPLKMNTLRPLRIRNVTLPKFPEPNDNILRVRIVEENSMSTIE